jgi:hypothetical protein
MDAIGTALLIGLMASGFLLLVSLVSGFVIKPADARRTSWRGLVESRPSLSFDWMLVRMRPVLVRICAACFVGSLVYLIAKQFVG